MFSHIKGGGISTWRRNLKQQFLSVAESFLENSIKYFLGWQHEGVLLRSPCKRYCCGAHSRLIASNCFIFVFTVVFSSRPHFPQGLLPLKDWSQQDWPSLPHVKSTFCLLGAFALVRLRICQYYVSVRKLYQSTGFSYLFPLLCLLSIYLLCLISSLLLLPRGPKLTWGGGRSGLRKKMVKWVLRWAHAPWLARTSSWIKYEVRIIISTTW